MNPVVGGTYKWKLDALKDGSIWNLAATPAQVIVSFWKDNRHAAKHYLTSGNSAGHVEFDNPATTFTSHGNWFMSWKIIDASLVDETPPIPITVEMAGSKVPPTEVV